MGGLSSRMWDAATDTGAFDPRYDRALASCRSPGGDVAARPAGSEQSTGSEVVEPGWSTTVQDRGRPGHAAVGVSPSGAVTRGCATSSTASSATIRRLRCSRPPAVSSSGRSPLLTVADSTTGSVPTLRPGEHHGRAGPGASSQRIWPFGGIDLPTVIGSRSRRTLASIGPEPVRPRTPARGPPR